MSTSSLHDREAVRVELREVEDVADEPLEPVRLRLDDLERVLAQLGVLDQALAQRRDVAADRGQRRAQLVRDRHEEVALERLGLGEPLGHLAEPLGEVPDLADRADRQLDVVVAARRPGRRRARARAPA